VLPGKFWPTRRRAASAPGSKGHDQGARAVRHRPRGPCRGGGAEIVPGSGIYIGTMFLSVNPLPGGFDLTGILTTVPGCNAYIATLDLDLGGMLNIAPTLSWSLNYDNVNFAPGNVIGAQAVALFDGAFPLLNGESGGFLLSNGLLSTTFAQ
jgi:hypothetical protein